MLPSLSGRQRRRFYRYIILASALSLLLFSYERLPPSAVPSSALVPLLAASNASSRTEDAGRRSLIRECTPRNGWSTVFSKVQWEESPVRVAFLGGSVTAKPDCWRPQVLELFRQRYPSVDWTEIDAAVGGTGSMFGAFRVDVDVIAHDPDLVFIEFAANDRRSAHNVRLTLLFHDLRVC
jgi:hypothetical protein